MLVDVSHVESLEFRKYFARVPSHLSQEEEIFVFVFESQIRALKLLFCQMQKCGLFFNFLEINLKSRLVFTYTHTLYDCLCMKVSQHSQSTDN